MGPQPRTTALRPERQRAQGAYAAAVARIRLTIAMTWENPTQTLVADIGEGALVERLGVDDLALGEMVDDHVDKLDLAGRQASNLNNALRDIAPPPDRRPAPGGGGLGD